MAVGTNAGFVSMVASIRVALGIAVAIGGFAACGECRCGVSGMTVDVPAQRAADVLHVSVSGPACQSVVPFCTDSTAHPCQSFQIDPSMEGACHIVVTFVSGASPVETDVVFRSSTGCCPGLAPANGGPRFEVPLDFSGDA